MMTAIRLRRRGLAGLHRRWHSAAQAALGRDLAHQRDAWEQACRDFAAVHARLARHREPQFVTNTWSTFESRIETDLLPEPPFDFQRSTTLRDTMVMVTGGRGFRRELDTCRAVWGAEKLGALAAEDYAGEPVLHTDRPTSSHTRIHHLHTLARYRLARGPGLEHAGTTIEWGGGFGGMARVLRRLGPPDATLVLIDLPILLALQWAYLSTTAGPDQVHLVDEPGAGIERGRINLVPNGLLAEIDVEPDVFLTTWALGESEPAAQDLCVGRGWLAAPHLVIADQRTRSGGANSDRLLDLAMAHGARLEPVGTVAGSFYAFR